MQSRWLLSTSIRRAFCFNPCRPLRNGSVPSARWSFLRLRQSVPSRGHPAGKHNSRGASTAAGKGGQEACLEKGANQDGRTLSLTRKLSEEQNWKAACHLKSNGSLTAGLGLPFLPCLLYIIGMVDCVCGAIFKEFEKTSALVIFKLQWSFTTQKDLCETKY